jgi:hypothetical protein
LEEDKVNLAGSHAIPISNVFASSNKGLSRNKIKGDNQLFWAKCLEIARDNPELCAEEVEYKAVRARMGLIP